MIKNGTWPFPPVIIEEGFARLLGAEGKIGSPYYLIEGTHRTSYARRMLELGLTATSLIVEVIEIMATNSPHVSRKINGVAGVANSKKLPTP